VCSEGADYDTGARAGHRRCVAGRAASLFGPKEGLDRGLVKALGACEVGQGCDIGQGRVAGDHVHGLTQRDDLQARSGAVRAAKGLLLVLKHLPAQDLGKIARWRMGVRLPGRRRFLAGAGGNRCWQ